MGRNAVLKAFNLTEILSNTNNSLNKARIEEEKTKIVQLNVMKIRRRAGVSYSEIVNREGEKCQKYKVLIKISRIKVKK